MKKFSKVKIFIKNLSITITKFIESKKFHMESSSITIISNYIQIYRRHKKYHKCRDDTKVFIENLSITTDFYEKFTDSENFS